MRRKFTREHWELGKRAYEQMGLRRSWWDLPGKEKYRYTKRAVEEKDEKEIEACEQNLESRRANCRKQYRRLWVLEDDRRIREADAERRRQEFIHSLHKRQQLKD